MNYYLKIIAISAAFLALSLSASAQLAHKGPSASIALSRTLAPFDVVSIKKNTTGDESFGIHFGQDGLVATNAPLKLLVQIAYDINPDLIAGLSGPVDDARFDMTAKVTPPTNATPPKLTNSQLSAMLIPLLAERFHLQTRVVQRTMPVYDLVVARGGPKLKLSDKPDVGRTLISGDSAKRVLSCESTSMHNLAAILSDQVQRMVLDKTRLIGVTDITLSWSDDVALQQAGSDVVSIFTALEEQLGLKLVPSKGPVDTIVIDHIEMPTQN